jgi:hypothetical protein
MNHSLCAALAVDRAEFDKKPADYSAGLRL